MDQDVCLLRTSLDRVRTQGSQFTHGFYERLFAACPDLPPRLRPTDLALACAGLVKSLELVARDLDRPESASARLERLGRALAPLGLERGHYDAAARALVDSLREAHGPDWSPELEKVWGHRSQELVSRVRREGEAVTARA